MFGREDPVVTDEDVGNFVKGLHESTSGKNSPLGLIITEVDNELAFASTKPTTGKNESM